MNEVKITVIIPTRERVDVLDKALKTVTSQDYDNLEIIVSDNYSSDATEDVVRSTNDARVKYLNTGKRLSMSHNWEFALSHVTDGWVTIIGDDDGLLPASLEKVSEMIRSADVRAIRSTVCSYAWPSTARYEFGRLEVPLRSGCEVRDSKTWLSKVLNGLASYPELPMLYNGGFVDMQVLKEIKSKTGAVYLSCVPDVYSAVSISSVIENYLYSNEPLAVNGASKNSAGTSHFSVGDNSDPDPAKKFRSEGNIPFHKDVPRCADGNYPLSLQALVYESYLQSAILRDDVREDMHEQQLELILASSKKHGAAVGEWGRLFAKAHGLDYDEINSRARRKARILKLLSAPGLVSNAFNMCSAGSSEHPIKDVYEASIVAAQLRKSPPGRLEIFRQLVVSALRKTKARVAWPN